MKEEGMRRPGCVFCKSVLQPLGWESNGVAKPHFGGQSKLSKSMARESVDPPR